MDSSLVESVFSLALLLASPVFWVTRLLGETESGRLTWKLWVLLHRDESELSSEVGAPSLF